MERLDNKHITNRMFTAGQAIMLESNESAIQREDA